MLRFFFGITNEYSYIFLLFATFKTRTQQTYKQRFDQYHKIWDVTRDLNVWLGEIIYPDTFERHHLETAEKIIVYFWQPELNERLKDYCPTDNATVISQWFKTTGDPRINQSTMLTDLHDVLSWDNEKWRTANLKVYDNE